MKTKILTNFDKFGVKNQNFDFFTQKKQKFWLILTIKTKNLTNFEKFWR